MRNEKILVSACLIGHQVRYDGRSQLCNDPLLFEWQRQNRLIAICPEVAGGLQVPRDSAEIRAYGGEAVLDGLERVINKKGIDVTSFFINGAQKALDIVVAQKIRVAILKAKSPSCGMGQIYDGSFTGRLVSGHGVTSALLMRNRVNVFTENQIGQVATLLKINKE